MIDKQANLAEVQRQNRAVLYYVLGVFAVVALVHELVPYFVGALQ